MYQADLIAIRLAMLEAQNGLGDGDKYIEIFSDLQAAIKALANFKVKSHAMGQSIRELNNTGNLNERLQMDWIKAHNNYPGNKRADKLA